ncbi:MAG TPA: S8 family peptidase, partial [Desulfobacteria bacterium]|nr:S8 family peptidase [Desulfobacteria bacterium]
MHKYKSLKKVLIVLLTMNLLVSQSFFALPGTAAQVKYNKLSLDDAAKLEGTSGSGKGFKDGEILLKVKGGVSEEKRVLGKYGMNLVQRMPRTGYVLASVKNQIFADTLGRLKREDSVVRVQPNYIYRTFGIPNDPQYGRQWALKNINGEKTLNTALAAGGGSPVTVAVLDTGVDVNHPDLRTRLVPGTNTVNPLKSSRDSDGHGTHIAGIISAFTNNMTGVAGVAGTAPVSVMPVKVFEGDEGSDVSISNGIIWAVDHGARVINMSFGSYAKSEVLNEAINYAYQKGVVLVAAAGNWASEEVSYPAAVSRVMAVSAINNKNNITEFSSFGSLIDICAPGEDIYSTYWDPYKGSTYTEMSGTSMASPMVAGLAALLLTKNPKLSNDEIRQIIEVSATDLGDSGWDTKYGHGKINVDKAMAVSLSRIDDQNNSSNNAASLTTGIPVKEKLQFGSDQDWFKINVPQNGHLQVEVLPAGKVSPGVEVYDESGKLLASFNSDAQPEKRESLFGDFTGEQSLNPVQFKVAEVVHGLVTNLKNGNYYIKVFGNHYRWSDREYTVTAWAIKGSDLVKDLNEPNNSYKKAHKISIGSRVTGTISSQWDQDWYKIELPGTIYKFEAKTPEGLDLAVDIENEANYDESSWEFGDYSASWFFQSINDAGIGGDEEGVLVLPRSRTSTYFLKVYDAGGGAYNGSYTITVSPYDLKQDNFEPNNILNSAAPVKLNQTVTG